MFNLLIAIVAITFLASVIILSKYIDFAKFMIDRKDVKEQFKNQEIQKIYIDKDENIIIDVEAEEINTVMPIKILENKYLKG